MVCEREGLLCVGDVSWRLRHADGNQRTKLGLEACMMHRVECVYIYIVYMYMYMSIYIYRRHWLEARALQ